MSVKIDLAPEIEKNLAAQAAAQGVPLPEYLRHLLEEQAAVRSENPLSPEERANYWRDSAGGLVDTRPLSDEAMSRETIYSERG
jgi:hypothetical protein